MEDFQRFETGAPATERMPMPRSPETSTAEQALESGNLETVNTLIEQTATRAAEQGKAFGEAADDHDSPEFTQAMQDLSQLLKETLEARANQTELEIAGAITAETSEAPAAAEAGQKLVELKQEKEKVDGELKDLETRIAGATEEEKPALEKQHAELAQKQSSLADEIGEAPSRATEGGPPASGESSSLERAVTTIGKAMVNPEEAAGALVDKILNPSPIKKDAA